jgi:hypothetical protein
VGLVVELGAPPVAPPAVETLEQVVADSLLVKPPSLPLAPLLGKGAASWRRLNENHAQLVGEICLHLAKTSFKATKLKYEKTLEELGFAFPPQQTLSEWKARVLLNQPARGVPGGNKVAILSVTERKQLIDALFGIGNAGAKVGLKLVKRLTTAILALSGKAYISGKNNAQFPSPVWCHNVFKEMGYSKRRGTKASRRQKPEEISEIQRTLICQLAYDIKTFKLSKMCVGNFDETGVFLFHQSNSTMAKTNVKQVHLVGHGEKRQYTLNNFGTASGNFAPLQIIFAGVWGKKGAVPKLASPIAGLRSALLTQTKDHWQTGDSLLEYCEKIVLPFVNQQRRAAGDVDGHFLLLVDVYPSHFVVSFRQWCKRNRILLHYIYLGLTGELQPMDIAVQGPFKDFVTEFMEEEYFQALLNQHMIANDGKFDSFDFFDEEIQSCSFISRSSRKSE